ncbi:hypothetical protein PIB30_032270 [Stylosanthes scabra]|uniref:Uncharacterized protein n=1 Tax=Stylosanthes scabra TaxID=79078 RepID=A0ABU6XDM1_9FABA|nr:hypothetical protein [Stylosanthes scabra]
MDELKSHIEVGKNHEDAFVQVLGKDQSGRLRCYEALITKNSLKKHEEIRQVRVEFKDLVSSLQQQMESACGLLTVMMQQINPAMSEEDIATLVQAARNSPSDASSSRPRVNTPHSSESTHFPPNGDFVCLPYQVDAVEAVVHPSILHPDHNVLWTSIIPLIYFGSFEWHQVDQVIPQFGGVQNAPHRPLNIDFLHARDGRVIDRWWPRHYQRWHGLWATPFDQVFEVAQSGDPGASADFLRWWYLTRKRYLAPANAFHQLPSNEISVEATQRQTAPHPQRSQVANVLDNKRPGGRMMVDTRTTARDWQWLDEMMVEDAGIAAPPQCIR